jgi:NADPH2:quinone reductase
MAGNAKRCNLKRDDYVQLTSSGDRHMARVARFEKTGGPEVIEWIDVDLPAPGPGEVQMRNTAVGLNFIDIYFRRGLYPSDLPSGLGSEAAGVIEAVGDGVEGFAVGDRVGTFGPARGAYATARNLPAAQVMKLPDSVDDRTAAALLLKGCTAEFLVERCAKVQSGQTVLVHAAAGGVGHLLVGWLKDAGATVIGTVGSEDKAAQAKAAGADHVLLHKQVDVAREVRAITGGKGVPVIFDGVGKATWDISLASAARRGLIVSYGNAGGAVTDVALGILAAKGSLFVTRPTLFDYYVDQEERQAGVDRLFEMLAKGAIVPEIGQTFALEDAADAHRALEAGETRGATVLIP